MPKRLPRIETSKATEVYYRDLCEHTALKNHKYAKVTFKAFKLVNRDTLHGAFFRGIKYVKGRVIKLKADRRVGKMCSYGLNVGTRQWCTLNSDPWTKILAVYFTGADIAAVPTNTDGKLRVSRLKVGGVVRG